MKTKFHSSSCAAKEHICVMQKKNTQQIKFKPSKRNTKLNNFLWRDHRNSGFAKTASILENSIKLQCLLQNQNLINGCSKAVPYYFLHLGRTSLVKKKEKRQRGLGDIQRGQVPTPTPSITP